MTSGNKANTIYTVEYMATVQEGILSLVIKSNLKQGNEPQRVIVQTYNYDLRNNKEINLKEILAIRKLEETKVKEAINKEIKFQHDKAVDLKELGLTIYDRDPSSDIYELENSTEFYVTGDTLYIIYAYGNANLTSETDLIIF